MKLLKLCLQGFRNYHDACVCFDSGVNLILGDNAQGKTNLLEAIHYLSTGRGFRTRKETELIRMGSDFAQIRGTVFSHDREQELEARLFAGRRPRQLYLGGVKQKTFSSLNGLLPTVLFCPEDLSILRAGSAARRKFLDHALCQLRPGYEKALTEYQRLLEHKSRILKDYHDYPSLLDALPDFNAPMAHYGAIIIGYRANYLEKLNRCAGQFHGEFSGNKEILSLEYRTVSTISDPHSRKADLEQKLLEHQRSHYEAELHAGQCLSGPHRDDFEVLLDGISLKAYGSQGQTRTAAISMKLAERQIFKEDTGEIPVLLLDDVLSELDSRRRDFVLNQICSGQVFITCCEPDACTTAGCTIHVSHGAAERSR